MNYELWIAVASVVGVVVSIWALIIESRRTRIARQLDLIIDLDKQFQSEGVKAIRKEAAAFLCENRSANLQDENWQHVDDVIDFIQTVGLFTKSGYMEVELVFKFFFFWIGRYITAAKPYIEMRMADCPVLWKEAMWLYGKLKAYDMKRNQGRLSDPSEADLDSFFRWEMKNN